MWKSWEQRPPLRCWSCFDKPYFLSIGYSGIDARSISIISSPTFSLIISSQQLVHIKERGIMIHLWSIYPITESVSGFLHLICGFALKSPETVRMKTQRYLKMTQTDQSGKWKTKWEKSGMKCRCTSIYAADVLLKIMCRSNWFIN